MREEEMNLLALHMEGASFQDPIYIFKESLSFIRSLEPEEFPKRVRLRQGGKDRFFGKTTIFSEKRQPSFLGYQIVISSGFYYLLRSILHNHLSSTQLSYGPADYGRAARSNPIDVHYSFAAAITHYIENEGSWAPTPLDLETGKPYADSPEGTGWGSAVLIYMQQMSMFALCHEIGHIALGHCDEGQDGSSISETEIAADEYAARLIGNEVLNHFRQQGQEQEEIDFFLFSTTKAAALLFSTLSAVEVAAERMNVTWDQHYPPARDRYEVVKQALAASSGRSQEFLNNVHPTFGTPGDTIIQKYSDIVDIIDWPSIRDLKRDHGSDIFYARLFELLNNEDKPQ